MCIAICIWFTYSSGSTHKSAQVSRPGFVRSCPEVCLRDWTGRRVIIHGMTRRPSSPTRRCARPRFRASSAQCRDAACLGRCNAAELPGSESIRQPSPAPGRRLHKTNSGSNPSPSEQFDSIVRVRSSTMPSCANIDVFEPMTRASCITCLPYELGTPSTPPLQPCRAYMCVRTVHSGANRSPRCLCLYIVQVNKQFHPSYTITLRCSIWTAIRGIRSRRRTWHCHNAASTSVGIRPTVRVPSSLSSHPIPLHTRPLR